MFSALQTKLIFVGAETQGRREAVVVLPEGAEMVEMRTAGGVKIAGVYGKVAGAKVTVISFYGNAMCLADAVGQMDYFLGLGVNVLMVEYEGYGMSEGAASEAGCYAAAEAGYRWVLSRGDADGKKIVPMGWSLGGAVAVELAHRHWREGTIGGLVTFCSFSAMRELGRFHYPMLPVRMILTHLFASEEKLGEICVPFFIAHGRRDEVVPFGMMGRLVKAAGSCRVVEFVSEGAGHNDFFEVAGEELEIGLRAFFESL